MPDIEVTFGADTSALDSAIAKIKAETQNLTPGGVGSGILTALPSGLGGAPADTLLSRATAAAKVAKEEFERTGVAMKNFAKAEAEVGEATGRMSDGFRIGSIDVGNMMERIAVRMVIFEALRLAIQGVKYAFDEISNLQQARLQFDAMADSADNLAGRFKYLQESAAAGFVPIEKATAAYEALKDLGVSENTAALATKDLDKWSQILGVDEVKLAEALGQVAEGTASLQQMRLVTRMMGDQGEAGRALVQNLVDLEKAQKALDVATAATEKTMAQELRTTQQASAEAERHLERGLSFTERVLTREVEAKRARGLETRTPTQVITEAFEGTGAGRGVRLPYAEMMEYRRGIEAIAQEQGMSQAQVHRLLREQLLDYHDVLAAAKQRTDDEKRNLTELDQKQRDMLENQRTAAGLAVTGAKVGIAAALPQAVTAPPADLWNQFANSLKGQGLQTKQDFDDGIQKVVTELGNVTKASNGTTTAVGTLENLFRSG